METILKILTKKLKKSELTTVKEMFSRMIDLVVLNLTDGDKELLLKSQNPANDNNNFTFYLRNLYSNQKTKLLVEYDLSNILQPYSLSEIGKEVVEKMLTVVHPKNKTNFNLSLVDMDKYQELESMYYTGE